MPIIDRIGAETRRRWAADGLYLLARGLAKTKLPERIETTHELPTNATGKILKRVLRDLLAAQLASPSG